MNGGLSDSPLSMIFRDFSSLVEIACEIVVKDVSNDNSMT